MIKELLKVYGIVGIIVVIALVVVSYAFAAPTTTIVQNIKVTDQAGTSGCASFDSNGLLLGGTACAGGAGGGSTTINGLQPSDSVFLLATTSGASYTITTTSPKTITIQMPAKLLTIGGLASTTGALIQGTGLPTGWAIVTGANLFNTTTSINGLTGTIIFDGNFIPTGQVINLRQNIYTTSSPNFTGVTTTNLTFTNGTGTLFFVSNVTSTNASTTNFWATNVTSTRIAITSIASGNCLQTGASGLIVSAGAACGTGGGSNTTTTIAGISGDVLLATSSAYSNNSIYLTTSSQTITLNYPKDLDVIATIATSTGSLIVGSSTGWIGLAVGSENTCLIASSTGFQNGIGWGSCSGGGGDGGITSLNGLVGLTQTFATTTLQGGSFQITSAGTEHTFKIGEKLDKLATVATTTNFILQATGLPTAWNTVDPSTILYLPNFITATSTAFTSPTNVSSSLYKPGFITATSTAFESPLTFNAPLSRSVNAISLSTSTGSGLGNNSGLQLQLGGNATQTCGGTDKVSSVSATGTITCTTDVTGAGSANSTTTADFEIFSCSPKATSTTFQIGNAWYQPIVYNDASSIYNPSGWAFANATSSEVNCQGHLPADFSPTSTVSLLMTWSATTTAAASSTFDINATSVSPYGGSFNPTQAQLVNLVASTTPYIQIPTTAGIATTTQTTISGITLNADNRFLLQIRRWGQAAADTMLGDIYLHLPIIIRAARVVN